MQDEIKELRLNVKTAEREVEKLRQVESSLYKTLKTAEDTGANIMDQANKAAELHLKESQMKAEGILSDAKKQARDMIEDAEMRSKMILEQMETEVKNLQQAYKLMANNYDNLLNDLKNLSNDALQRVEKGREAQNHHHVDSIVEKAMKYGQEDFESSKRTVEWETNHYYKEEKMVEEEKSNSDSGATGSFFDQIE